MTSRAWMAALGITVCLALPEASGAAPGEVPPDDTDSEEEEQAEEEEEEEPQAGEIEVIGTVGVPDRDDPTERELSVEEGIGTPGVQGDPIKAAQTVVGVGRSAPGGDGLVLWGASSMDTRRYIDDVPVPRLFHLGGVRSVLPAPAVQSVSVIPAGQRARYGRGVGGVVSVRTAEPLASRVGGWLAVDPVDVGAGAHARWQGGWVSGHARLGVLNRVADLVAPSRSAAVFPIPSYADAHVRLHHELANGDTLTLTVLGSEDRLVREIASIQPERAFSETTRRSFGRVAATLDRDRGEGATRVLAWAGVDRDDIALDYGSVSAGDARRSTSGGVLLQHGRALSPGVQVRLGLDGEASATAHERKGAVAVPAREGDLRVFGQAPGDRRNADTWTVGQASLAGFATFVLETPSGLTVAPGLRVEPTLIDGDRVFPARPSEPSIGLSQLMVRADPRIRMSWSPGEQRLRLFAVGGGVHQAPDASDLSPVFGTPRLPPTRGWQAAVGLSARPASTLQADLVVFATRQQQLIVRAAQPTPPLAGLLVAEGAGRTEGAQISVRAGTETVDVRIAYTLLQARRRGTSLPGDPPAAWRPFDGDQPHALQALVGARLPLGFELGGRAELSSGFPRTPVADAIFDASTQAFDPVFGAHNAERLPLFFSASARLSWTGLGPRAEYRVWVDVQNITNRKNVEEWAYAADYSSRNPVRGLPLLAVMGLQVSL